MKKITTLFLLKLFLLTLSCYAQIGIKTESPQGVLHIDPLENNTTADTNKYTDDVVVDENGNMGVGLVTPQAKLHIKSAYPALQINDGTEGSEYVLKSDAVGIARWVKHVDQQQILLDSTPIVNNGATVYSGKSITLSGGLWIVKYNITVRTSSATTSSAQLKAVLSTSSTSVSMLPGSFRRQLFPTGSSTATSVNVIPLQIPVGESLTVYLWWGTDLKGDVTVLSGVNSFLEAITWR